MEEANRQGRRIYADISQTVGVTHLVRLARIGAGLPGRIVAKLEMRNPAGSVKDRLGIAMIEDAERRGVLRPGMTIVEATGGNTGIGLASAAAVRGYKIVLTMPSSMSRERVALLRQYGAEVILTAGILMAPAVDAARQLAADNSSVVYLDQFSNPANPALHERTTGPEIWNDCDGDIDVFVSAVGTGGTITGVGRFLKKMRPGVRIVAVEPEGAAVLSGKSAGEHRMPGIGVGFIPPVLDQSIIDEIIPVSDEDAFNAARNLAKLEGILAGVSSGAALCAAEAIAQRSEFSGRTIVVLLADTGERYLTSELFYQQTHE